MLAAFLCLNIYLKLSWRSSQYVFGCIIPQWSTRLHCFHKSKCRANGAIMLQFILHFWAHCPSLREMCLVLRCQLNICVVLEIKMLFNHVRWYNLLILMMSDLASWQCLKTVAWLHDLSAFKDSHTHTHTHTHTHIKTKKHSEYTFIWIALTWCSLLKSHFLITRISTLRSGNNQIPCVSLV